MKEKTPCDILIIRAKLLSGLFLGLRFETSNWRDNIHIFVWDWGDYRYHFHLHFDQIVSVLLIAVLSNISSEIYVQSLLEKTPYLKST